MNTKHKVRSVKGKTKGGGRRPVPKTAPNRKRNRPYGRKKAKIDAIPASQNLTNGMYAAMKGD